MVRFDFCGKIKAGEKTQGTCERVSQILNNLSRKIVIFARNETLKTPQQENSALGLE